MKTTGPEPASCVDISRGWRRRLSLYGVAAFALVAMAVAETGSPRVAEPTAHDRTKADYVIRMLDFVEWPDDLGIGDSVATVGTVGDGPVVTALEQRSGRRIDGRRRLEVIRIADPDRTPPCHIVYVADARLEAEVLRSLDSRPVLTIGESPSFITAGGMMRFIQDDDGSVQFELSPDAANRAGLRLSSRVLEIARIAGTEPER